MVRSLARNTLRHSKRIAAYSAIACVVLLLTGGVIYSHFFGPAASYAEAALFVIEPNTPTQEIADELKAQGIVKSVWALKIALLEESKGRTLRAGSYSLSKDMDAWSIAKTLTGIPQMAFVNFPPGLRKEQIGDILENALGWSKEELANWNNVATNPDPDFAEGVYYPGTYLVPSDQSPSQIAARMRGRFTDEFAPYAKMAQDKGLDWTEVLTLASIVDKEAGANDKALVAGILWNRLDTGMKLQADATLQYAKGKEGNWWPAPTSADKYIASAFNTYQHVGLPPHPIDNPSLASIEATINSQNTDCLFYLHDPQHQIHCSLTYAGQVRNVNTYLR